MVTNSKLPFLDRPFDRWLLDSIILLLPSYLLRFQFGGLGFNLLDLVIAVTFCICVLRYRGLRVGEWRWPMLIFLGIASVAVLAAPDKIAALGLWKSYCLVPICVGAMVLTLRPELSHLTKTVAGLVAYLSLIALGQYLTGYGIPAPWNAPGPDYRATSLFEYPNAVGLLLAPCVIWLLAAYIHRLERSWWILIASSLGVIAILLSRSDGAVAAVVAALVLASCYTRRRWFVVTGVICVIIGALLLPATRQILLFQDTSGQVRLALWQGTLNLLSHHPWLGAGLGGFPTLYAQYKLDRHVELLLYPHNIFLDFWVEFGILGLVWLIIILIHFFRRLSKHATPSAIVLMSIMFGIIVYGLVDVPYFKNDLAVLFWIILTLSTVVTLQLPHKNTE